ncbi:hypothetical protein BRARA_A00888 [Brassica rapa]|uniref:Uncharacterized protein n=1 Tax=Brassica campestris TaxID=3711 RepID=A0A398AJX6_BRACM|nr:hypothetical protein BRARA_A00888 [Brassica rapa]
MIPTVSRLDATTTRLTGAEYDRDVEELSTGAAGRSTSSTTTTTEAWRRRWRSHGYARATTEIDEDGEGRRRGGCDWCQRAEAKNLKESLNRYIHGGPWLRETTPRRAVEEKPSTGATSRLLVQLLSTFDYAKDSYEDVEWIDSSLG